MSVLSEIETYERALIMLFQKIGNENFESSFGELNDFLSDILKWSSERFAYPENILAKYKNLERYFQILKEKTSEELPRDAKPEDLLNALAAREFIKAAEHNPEIKLSLIQKNYCDEIERIFTEHLETNKATAKTETMAVVKNLLQGIKTAWDHSKELDKLLVPPKEKVFPETVSY
jgi:hypothetical protein